MLKELFAKNPYIIINTDIDGILSGIILCKYCNCQIVGFTNSKDTVWLADNYNDLYKYVYIDMFVTNDKAICIDQHVVAVNDTHMKNIIKLGNKFSPQSDDANNLRIFSSKGFKNKYPFGTVQYLIAQLESEGVKISLPDLNTPVPNSKIKIGDLLHRADDAMKTSLYAYKSNADFWWKWLDKKAPNGSIEKMKEYLEIMESSSVASVNADGMKHKKKDYEDHKIKIVEDIKEKTKNYFKEQFQCKSSDGGFNNIVDEHGIILPNIEQYCKSVALLCGFKELTIPNHYVVHSGKAYRTRWLDIFENDFLKDYTICGHKIFSYAFIYGPDNDGQTNFSFTIDMK
jgi:hypothetical protein